MAKTLQASVGTTTAANPTDQLRQEYTWHQSLFEAQLPIIQRFLEVQGRQVAEAYTERAQHVHFTLPDRVICKVEEKTEPLPVPQDMREQSVGKLVDRLTRRSVHETLHMRLAELEQSTNPAVSTSAGLIRFASVMHIIHNMLPSGRTVTYQAKDEDEIPSLPTGESLEPESAITASTDAIAEEAGPDNGRGSLQVPFVPAARRFYLPQWVAFDDEKILVNSINEAEGYVVSMQRFLEILFNARSIAPYSIVDPEYQKKRYGMLGQLVNQGRALARYQTLEIIRAIQARAAAQSLNRGLSLSLPYFDDQSLRMKTHNFVVIPAGRIMFVPAFVVRAAVEEQAKVAQDTRFSQSTRRHLLEELQLLGDAFVSPGE